MLELVLPILGARSHIYSLNVGSEITFLDGPFSNHSRINGESFINHS